MRAFRPWRCLACLLISSLMVSFLKADSASAPTTDGKQSTSQATDAARAKEASNSTSEKKTGTSFGVLDLLKLPSGAIIVLCEQSREGNLPLPRSVLVPLEEYQKMLEHIEQARRPSRPDRSETPTSCHLTGHVEGDVVILHVRFGFRTYRPRTLMHLGCLKAWPVAAKLDGNLPVLQLGDDGLQVLVESTGEHQVHLDLIMHHQLRRSGKGRERVMELDLPRTAITMLDSLELPAQAAEVRLGNRVLPLKKSATGNQRLERIACSYADLLDLTWRFQESQTAPVPPSLAATGKFVARVSDGGVFLEGELILRALQGETAVWQVGLPQGLAATAEVNVLPADQARLLSLDRPTNENEPTWTIRLREASAEPLHLRIQARQAWQHGPVDLGPVRILHCLSQKGDIEIRSPVHLRPQLELKGEISQKEISDEPNRDSAVVAYNYWSGPDRAKPAETMPGFLRLNVEPVRGNLSAKLTCAFRYIEANADDTPVWKLAVKVEVTPSQTSVEVLDLLVPEEASWEAAPGFGAGEPIERLIPSADKRIVRVLLAQKQTRPFTLQLVGTYRLPREVQVLDSALPRVSSWSGDRSSRTTDTIDTPSSRSIVQDQGAVLQVQLPEKWELLPGSWSDSWKLLPGLRAQQGTREYSWQIDSTPKQIHLAWRAFAPHLTAESIVDVELLPTQARIQQELRFTRPSHADQPILLRLPASMLEPIEIRQGGRRLPDLESVPGTLAILLDPRLDSHDPVLKLAYRLPLPPTWMNLAREEQELLDQPAGAEAAAQIVLPLVVPAQALRHMIKLRLWTEVAIQPHLIDSAWESLPGELVPGKRGLPVVVARASRAEQASFIVNKRTLQSLATACVDRILVRTKLSIEGSQTITACYVLSHIQQKDLEIELPISVGSNPIAVSIDQQNLPVEWIDEPRREGTLTRVLRVPIEAFLQRSSAILQVTCQLSTNPSAEETPVLASMFEAPRLRNVIQIGKTRWCVWLPDGRIGLWTRGVGEQKQRWGFWGFLVAPRPAWTEGQLMQWLGLSELGQSVDPNPTLVLTQDTLTPFELVHIPDRLWLVIGSLALFFFAVLAYLVPRPRLFGALTAGLLIPLVVWLLVQHSSFLRMVVFGLQPGVLVLLVVGCLEWALRHRSQRKLVFLPGFQRVKSGSSLIREGVGAAARIPSTIDEIAKRGSSLSGPSNGEGAS